MPKTKLDKDEQDILDTFERGEWKPVANRRQEIARHVAYATNTLANDSMSRGTRQRCNKACTPDMTRG